MSEFKQKSKVGVAGSFFNQMMGNNQTLPEVGKGATRLHYTDRTCYEVVEVSKDKKTVKLEYLKAVAKGDNNPMGHQNWELSPTGQFITVVWKWNKWRIVSKQIRYTKDYSEKHEDVMMLSRTLTEEQHAIIYPEGSYHPAGVVPGVTEEYISYSEIKLLFGEKNYYYDWSF